MPPRWQPFTTSPSTSVNKDMRRHGKSINFGLVYGMSAFGLARYAGLTLAEAENFVKAYFQKFPGVKRYLDGIRRLATQQGYVETLLGRRRYFPNLRLVQGLTSTCATAKNAKRSTRRSRAPPPIS